VGGGIRRLPPLYITTHHVSASSHTLPRAVLRKSAPQQRLATAQPPARYCARSRSCTRRLHTGRA